MIEFDQVTVAVPSPGTDHEPSELTILHSTSLQLDEHRVALIGANGSGKSTLARLINGLVSPTTGQVRVDGVDVATNGRAVRRRVAFAFTDPSAQLVMPTVIEDVELSLRRAHRRRADRTAAAMATLREYGLDALAHRSVHTLSGGQRQLLALAGVLATDPDVLVADEPTTLLDLHRANAIGDRLMGLRQQLVLVTHDLDLAARCERVIEIADGRVVGDGPPQPVIAAYRTRPVSP